MKKIILLIFLTGTVLFSFAQNGWRKAEMQIRVHLISQKQADRLHQLNLDAEQHGPDAVDLYVTPSEAELVKQAGFTFDVVIADLNQHYSHFWDNRVPNGYMTYDQIVALADSLATAFPDICKKVLFGTSVGGRQLGALKISDNVNFDEPEAAIMFDGGIHGDEVMGPEVVIRYAREICKGYGTDPVYTDLINTREIWLYYMVNPDGRVNMVRYNNNNVDCNRDAGYMWNAEGSSPGAFSQAESRALRDCMIRTNPVVYTNYHGGDEIISYPWSYRTEACPDEAHMDQLASVYSSASGYANLPYGQGYNIMYPINGSNKDFQYGVLGNIGWSIEITLDKQPPSSQIIPYYNKNKPAITEMIKRCGYGAEGIVTDSITGEPVFATVWISSFYTVLTRPAVGDYHKYLLPGTYTMKIMANGYETRTFTGITVPATGSVVTNVKMKRLTGRYAVDDLSCRIPLGSFTGFTNAAYTPGISGGPDNVYYSLWKGGWIIVDMGDTIFNGPGDDLRIHEGGSDPEGFAVYAGNTKDGPWMIIGNGNGTSAFDLSDASGGPVAKTRYLKIVDDNDGTLSGTDIGFDLDAVEMITQPLIADFIASDKMPCEGSSVSFSDYTAGTPVSWQWDFPGGTPSSSSEQDPQNITYSTPGVYPVTLKVTNAYCSNTRTKTGFITVGSLPVLELGNDTAVEASQSLLLDAGNPGCAYLWSTGATTSSVTVDSTGTGYGTATYWVSVTTPSNCTVSDTIHVTYTHPAGISITTNSDFTLRPNPVTDILNIDFGKAGVTGLEIISASGKKVLAKDYEVSTAHDIISVKDFPRGIYLVKVINGSVFSIGRIILE